MLVMLNNFVITFLRICGVSQNNVSDLLHEIFLKTTTLHTSVPPS